MSHRARDRAGVTSLCTSHCPPTKETTRQGGKQSRHPGQQRHVSGCQNHSQPFAQGQREPSKVWAHRKPCLGYASLCCAPGTPLASDPDPGIRSGRGSSSRWPCPTPVAVPLAPARHTAVRPRLLQAAPCRAQQLLASRSPAALPPTHRQPRPGSDPSTSCLPPGKGKRQREQQPCPSQAGRSLWHRLALSSAWHQFTRCFSPLAPRPHRHLPQAGHLLRALSRGTKPSFPRGTANIDSRSKRPRRGQSPAP